MTASPKDQLAARNRLRRALLAFQSAQILVLTHQRRELNRRGIPAPRGGAWSHMQAGALLRRLEAAT
jgi:hypothetical protein